MVDLLILIPIALFAVFAPKLVLTDFREHRLPNKFTITLIICCYLTLLCHLWLTESAQGFLRANLAGILTASIGWLMVKYLDLGMGDVKLLISLNAIAAWFGLEVLFWSMAVSLVLGSLFGIGHWIKFKDPKAAIALGPFLIFGFAICLVSPVTSLITEVV